MGRKLKVHLIGLSICYLQANKSINFRPLWLSWISLQSKASSLFWFNIIPIGPEVRRTYSD